MKKIVFLFISFIFIGCFGQSKSGTNTQNTLIRPSLGNFDEFWGLNFQMNQDDVKNVLVENGFDVSAFTKNKIRAGGIFENRTVDIQLRFYNDKLFEGSISNKQYESDESNNIILSSIIEKYGNPNGSSSIISSWSFDNNCSLSFYRGTVIFEENEIKRIIKNIEPEFVEFSGGIFLYNQTPFNELGITIRHYRNDEEVIIYNYHEDLHHFSIVINAKNISGNNSDYYFRPATSNITSILRKKDINDGYIFSLYAFYTAFGSGIRWSKFNQINYISVYSEEGFYTTKDGENRLYIF